MSDVVDMEPEETLIPLGAAFDNIDSMRRGGRDVFGDGPRLTDSGNAERWVNHHGGSGFRFHKERSAWLRWDDRRWADDDGQALLSTKDVARSYLVDAVGAASKHERDLLARHADKSESASSRAAMLKLAAAEPTITVVAADLDKDPWLFCCSNGTLDLRTGLLQSHRRSDLLTKIAPVPFIDDAVAPRFEKFLAEIMPDVEVRTFLQRFFGYCLTGVIREHVLPIFWGATSRNGKGTLVETLLAILGPYACPIPADLLMEKNGEAHPTEKAQLHQLRFAVASESKQQKRLDEDVIKNLTGQDSIRARFMHKDFFSFEPTHKLALQTNYKPVIRGGDPAVWARLRLVPFEVSFLGREDVTLREKLKLELPGILRWLVDGCLAWQREGLGTAGKIEEATAEYRSKSDNIAAFLEECCVVAESARVQSKVLYDAYRIWTEARGGRPQSINGWAESLEQKGWSSKKSDGRMLFRGLGLLHETERQGGREAQGVPAKFPLLEGNCGSNFTGSPSVSLPPSFARFELGTPDPDDFSGDR